MPSNKHGHHWIRDKKRAQIHERDGWRCAWCFALLVGRSIGPTDRTLDHVMPRTHGGGNDARNLVTACGTCNTMRGDLSAPEFARIVANKTGARLGLCAAEIESVAYSILDRIREWTRRELPATVSRSTRAA